MRPISGDQGWGQVLLHWRPKRCQTPSAWSLGVSGEIPDHLSDHGNLRAPPQCQPLPQEGRHSLFSGGGIGGGAPLDSHDHTVDGSERSPKTLFLAHLNLGVPVLPQLQLLVGFKRCDATYVELQAGHPKFCLVVQFGNLSHNFRRVMASFIHARWLFPYFLW